ncbi:DUF418 domain-containing protein [Sphingosinicella rhizophila]|uniref:DUF418 domain-containing protein n=1 Tax=Sphingosinicella rhizophila TaxID=3050082 RepID=A0ABU3Q3P2_9SPHN|nr:DUF418 domain-containing protein [Sphingosinicella sp. GR2756]MDT9598029.1 DUF418 domain-containing protein [Sphingosinicella sp. GR2756]
METGARVVTLDILRGVAVMGILAMNIIGFSMPEPAYSNPAAYGGSTGLDLAAWTFNFIFVDGRMRGLFSFLFGASLLLVIDRAEAKGEDPGAVHFRRMAWLLLFGLLHFWLIWWGDILAHYAMIGLVAFAFRHQPAGKLALYGIGFIAIETALMALTGARFIEAARDAASSETGSQAILRWEAMRSQLGPLPPAELDADLALHRGPYLPLVIDRLHNSTSLVNSLTFVGPETLGYMLMGMAGLKSGFLTGAWEAARYRRWATIGFAVATPSFGILAVLIIRSGFDPALVAALSLGATTPLRPIMIVALAALIILISGHGRAWSGLIAAVGRAAFTNYLATSMVMTTFFYGYGFGLYGRMGRAEVYLPVLAMWLLILVWSKLWLDHFRYGPLEWLWRSLARGAFQPMRRA